PDLPAGVREAAQEALRALDAVRDGKMSLAVASVGGETPVSEGVRLQVAAPDRLFTADLLSRY
nr:hypothetical protein [Chromatiaceae bacterium]